MINAAEEDRISGESAVVTHFEIWAASQISAIMDQSHRIWQSNG
jgi:hypothetical protein